MEKEKHICVAYKKVRTMVEKLHAYNNAEHYKCQAKATIFENGKWYCKKHAPSNVELREDKKWQTYVSKIQRNVDRNS
jgi:hypothetical protein